jgi:hypothetical protein
MTGEADQTSIVIDDAVASGTKSAAGTESEATSASSSSNMVVQTMVKKKVPKLNEYCKAPTITENDLSAYHATSWLSGGMICSTATLDFPIIDRTNIVCFESHLMCGLGLPTSKFLVFILNFIGCELVHLNQNAITALSCFSMLCQCWLGIPLDTSLFWYFYSPARYECRDVSGIRLTLCHTRRDEYLNVKFRGY